MARRMGKDGVVQVGGAAVAEVQSWELNDQRNVAEASIMGQDWVGHGVGPARVTGTMTVFRDTADATGQGALGTGQTVALKLYEEGVGSGLPELDIASAVISANNRTVEPEAFNTLVIEFAADSALVESTQA